MNPTFNIGIIGGGAAGFFAAIRAGEYASQQNRSVQITILEASSTVLKKVKISGGGRCNVTHHCFDIREFVKNYPRGQKELLSPLYRFQAKDTVEWFQQKGVRLVVEDDGRMFPDTNSSQTIIDCFLKEIEKWKIDLKTNSNVKSVAVMDNGLFQVVDHKGETFNFDKLLIATGSSTWGYTLAQSLGHTITDLAPSLFSFKIENPLLHELSGLSFTDAHLKLKISNATDFKQRGPMLITHWGLSGPAILKLSAWAAREMKTVDYKAQLVVNWLGIDKIEDIQNQLQEIKQQRVKTQIKNSHPQNIAQRFWLNILSVAQILPEKVWADISKKEIQTLSNILYQTEFSILGKNRFKDEFVECGGVSLKEIDFKNLQSKKQPGLYFAGEILDIDGITGGFNFQNAWSTGWIVGTHMVEESSPKI